MQSRYDNYLKTKKTKRQFNIKSKWILWAAVAGFVLVVAGLFTTVGLFAYVAKDLPSPDKIVRREGFATKIYDRNGQLLYDVFTDQRRTPIQLSQVPLTLQQATIAIEDKNFYKHAGFDLLTPFRIGYNFVFKHRVVGGSTLSQQLVKKRLLTDERTLSRKVKEFILTLQVEAKYNKDQILQMYLNEVPYGGTAYGIEAAAETFFGKPVKDVTLTESAILAGLPQSPTRYSPFAGKLYIDRTKEVLRRMREDGYITSEQEKSSLEELPNVGIASDKGFLKAPHFVFYVRQLLEEKFGESIVEQGGLKVTTSLDLNLQEEAEKIVAEEIDKVKHLKISNGSAVVEDVNNGQILAMVGSRGWNDPGVDGKFNVATALRQPGSTIKPITYLAGLKKGYSASTMLMDVKTAFPGGDKPEYVPENYDLKYRGPVLVRDALGNSLNVPAVKMLSLVGIPDMLQLAYDMGLSTLEPTSDFLKRVGLAVTLGGGEVRLLDMVTAYSAFANGGKKVEPVAILRVTDNQGNVLEEWKEKPIQQVISPEEAFVISSILSDPAARSITFGAATSLTVPNKVLAVKTGTTNDKKDNWTIGWSNKGRIGGVWVGNNNNTSMTQVASGITGASPIWKRIMTTALKDIPTSNFEPSSGIITMDIDKISGWAAHDGYPSKQEYFIKGTEPAGDDPIHKKIKVCRGEGRLATPADVASSNYDEREAFYFKEEDPFEAQMKGNKWQEGILNWLKDQQDPKYHPPTDFCGTTNPVWITIQEPQNGTRTDNEDVSVRVNVSDINKITKVEFYLDGELKYSLNSEPWEITLPNVTKGKHKIDIRAENEKGQVGTRFVEIAVKEDF